MHCLRTTVDYLDAISPVKITRSILVIQSGCIGTFKRFLEQVARSHWTRNAQRFCRRLVPLIYAFFYVNDLGFQMSQAAQWTMRSATITRSIAAIRMNA